MQFKFDANQEFQITAIEAVADVLQGQSRISAEMRFSLGTGFAAVANRLDLSEAALLENLHAVQVRSKLTADAALEWIEEEIETAEGKRKGRFANFSVEMETGTGKTYVYIRTAMELFRRYGLRKFIVVVPSVAVREGVLKTFQITEKHLRELYDNLPSGRAAEHGERIAGAGTGGARSVVCAAVQRHAPESVQPGLSADPV